ncbi:FUSC family protein [Nocardioides dubius]|uniref:FUSC family protein n=1 Tax=Nocardioides dubius TaxID=317019 RepID=A0ABP4EG81_9ACTN
MPASPVDPDRGPAGRIGLFHLKDSPGAHRVALRAGLSVAVPLLACLALDHPEWTLYAAFGAFTSLYGRNHIHLPRAVMQASAGVALTLTVVAGAAMARAGITDLRLLLGSLVVVMLGQLIAERQDWHPPGPIFLSFAFGAVASAPPLHDSLWVPAAVAGLTALFGVVIGNVGAVVRRQRSDHAPSPRPLSGHAVRLGIGVLLAGSLALASGLGHPYWAIVALVAALAGPDLASRSARAWHRVLGTLAGLLPAAILLSLPLSPVGIVLTVVVLQVLTELVVGRNYALALLCITPMALLMGQLAAERPIGGLLLDRGAETAIGGAVALAMIVAERLASRRRAR